MAKLPEFIVKTTPLINTTKVCFLGKKKCLCQFVEKKNEGGEGSLVLLVFRAVRIWESFTQKPLPEKVSPVGVVDWVENSFIRKKKGGCRSKFWSLVSL